MQEIEELINTISEQKHDFEDSQKIALSIVEEQEKLMPPSLAKLKMIGWEQAKVA